MQQLKTFLAAEDGAVTVEFTVVTAVIVILAIAVAGIILAAGTDAASALAQSIIDYLQS